MDFEYTSNLKFLSCKIIHNDTINDVTIEYYRNLDETTRLSFKDNLVCPDCETAKITFVNGVNPYFRTKRKSNHSETCGKAVKSNIKDINEVNESSVEKLIARILEKSVFQTSKSNDESTKELKQKSISKYKTKSLTTITDLDSGHYYCYYARNIKIQITDRYLNYNYIRIFKNQENSHFISIKIKKEHCPIMYNQNSLYDIAFFGKFDVKDTYKDVLIENPKFISLKKISWVKSFLIVMVK